ncbi:MAG: T9SS type A sorting domain-containing protein [Crocinitomicaceae bacterium]|nr:T9SS type A sorting domain-containing protein [Crocinitomicaceae bacterium]
MKNPILLFLILLSINYSSIAQVYEHGDGLISDNGTSDSSVQGFAVDQSGNTYGVHNYGSGWSISYSPGIVSGSGSAKHFKHDKDGNLIWEFSGGTNAAVRDMQIDELGNIYIQGYQNFGFLTASNCPNSQNFTNFIAKMNPDGSFAWMTRMPGTVNMTTTAAGKVGFSVMSDPSSAPIYLGNTLITGGTENIVYGELEMNGDVSWYNVTPGNFQGPSGSVRGVAYNNDKLYMYGYYHGTFDFGGIQYTLNNLCNSTTYEFDMFIAEVDCGSQSVTEVIETDQLHIVSMDFDLNNNIIFAFQHNNFGGTCNPTTGGFMGTVFTINNYSNEGYIFKTDDQYNVLAVHDLGGPYTGQIENTHLTDLEVNGNAVYVAFQSLYSNGYIYEVDPSVPNANHNHHCYIMRLDDSLNYKYHTSIMLGAGGTTPRSILIDSKGDHFSSIAHIVSPFTSSSFPHNWFIGSYKTNANLVEGIVFRDFNYNDQYDSGDIPYAGSVLSINPSPYLIVSQLDGTFSAYLDSGTYEFSVPSIPVNYNAASPLTSVTFNGYNLSDYVEVPIIPTPNVNDIEIEFFSEDQLIVSELSTHVLIVENVGTIVQDVAVEITPLNLPFPIGDVEICWALTDVGGSYHDTLLGMLPGDTVHYQVYYNTPTSMLTNIGDIGTTTASATTVNTDVTPLNNTSTFAQTVLAAYDPNIKVVQEPYYLDYFNLSDVDYIHYTIHFQNEGNYPATNVRVSDEIEDDLVLTSLKIISASDSVYATIMGQTIHFYFDSIMLVPQSVDELGSRGYVHFKILRNSALTLGDMLINSAEIYFDNNPAIITNDAINIVIDNLDVEELGDDRRVVIYPNPASEKFTLLNVPKEVKKITLYDEFGTLVLNYSNVKSANGEVVLQFGNLPTGFYILKIGEITRSVVIQ